MNGKSLTSFLYGHTTPGASTILVVWSSQCVMDIYLHRQHLSRDVTSETISMQRLNVSRLVYTVFICHLVPDSKS